MGKVSWKPGTMEYPLPAVLVSCGETPEEYNVLTIAWTGTICSDPPMCYISVRPSRHSYEIIKRTGAFVINLTNEDLAKATDWCGVRSGEKYNKWEEMGLTPSPAEKIKAPIIVEAPVHIECSVKQIIELGSHHMFMAEVVNVMVDDHFIDPNSGAFDMKKAGLIAYMHGNYYKIGELIGKFGWSVEKSKTKQKRINQSKS